MRVDTVNVTVGKQMRVTKVETIWLEEFSNVIWIQIHTDEGSIGLGETFFGARAVEAYIHETIAPYLLGKDPLQIDLHAPEVPDCRVALGGEELPGGLVRACDRRSQAQSLAVR